MSEQMRFKLLDLDLSALTGDVEYKGDYVTIVNCAGQITFVDENGGESQPFVKGDTLIGRYNRFRIKSSMPNDLVSLALGTGQFIKGANLNPIQLNDENNNPLSLSVWPATPINGIELGNWTAGQMGYYNRADLSDTPQGFFHKALLLQLHVVTAPGGGETLTVTVSTVDALGNHKSLKVFTPITATGDYTLYVGPDYDSVSSAYTEGQKDALPPTWNWAIAHSGSGTWNYSLSGWNQ